MKNGTNYLSNGGNISGANTATLVLANVSHADEGSYSLIVTNDLGSATSSEAVLTVFDLPVITADPQSSTNNAGDTVSFTVSATGPSLSYQWRKNGSNLTDGGNVSGASSSALTLSNVGVTDASNYNVVVSNPGGSVTSAVASLTVICPAVGMTPASLPDGTLNASYSQTLSGTGGAAPYSFV